VRCPPLGFLSCSLRIFLEVSRYNSYNNYNKLRIFLESQILCPVALTEGDTQESRENLQNTGDLFREFEEEYKRDHRKVR